MSSPYRESASMPAIAPVLTRKRVYRNVPIWAHVVSVVACILGDGALVDIYDATTRWHGLQVAGIGVVGMLGIAAFVSTGSLTYSSWKWVDASERPTDADEGGSR